MYTCIAFDVDGTLIDTRKAVIHSLRRTLAAELGCGYTDAQLAVALGLPGEVTLARFPLPDPERTLQAWHRNLKEDHVFDRVFPGIERTLQAVRQSGYRTAVVTNRRRFELDEDPLFQWLAHHFDAIICSCDAEQPKPSPDMLQLLSSRLGIKPSEILYVGDTVYDSQCSRSAGCDFALAGWGASDPDSIEARYTLFHPYEIVEILFLHQPEAI